MSVLGIVFTFHPGSPVTNSPLNSHAEMQADALSGAAECFVIVGIPFSEQTGFSMKIPCSDAYCTRRTLLATHPRSFRLCNFIISKQVVY